MEHAGLGQFQVPGIKWAIKGKAVAGNLDRAEQGVWLQGEMTLTLFHEGETQNPNARTTMS